VIAIIQDTVSVSLMLAFIVSSPLLAGVAPMRIAIARSFSTQSREKRRHEHTLLSNDCPGPQRSQSS
jgi:hypothetical protein